jgi:MFS transporter, DHA1 family, multidrug resistance protein
VNAALRPAGRSRTGLALVLGALAAFGPLAVDMYLPAFPALAEHFDTTVGSVQITLSTCLIGFGLGQAVWGPLADMYGRRRPLVAGLVLFTAASVACAFASSVGALAGLRFVQAIGGCAGMVIGRAIVRDLFAGVEAAKFFSLLMLVFGVAPVLAPLIGGQLLHLGWQAIFLALAGLGLACLIGVLFLPETLPVDRRRRAGFREAFDSYGRLLRHRAFMVYSLTNAFAAAGMIAYISASPSVVIEQYDVSPQLFGFVFGVNALGLVAASQLVGGLAERIGLVALLRLAVFVQASAAVVLLILGLSGLGGLWALLVAMFVVVASLGAIMPTGTALGMTPFPQMAGAASALFGTIQGTLGAVTAAVVGMIGLEPAAAMGIVVAAACVLAATVLTLGAPRLGPAPAHETA